MAQLLGVSFPGNVLADAQVQSAAKCKSEIGNALAGRARLMNEWVTGDVADTADQCAPNAMMAVGAGHNHSGGADGAPILHTFGCWSFGQGPGSITDVTNGSAPYAGVSSAGSADFFDGPIFTAMVPMCAPDGCYVSAEFAALVEVDAACTVQIQVANLGVTTTFSHEFMASGVLNILASASDRAVRLMPGVQNTLRVRCTVTYTSASANAALLQLALHQRKTEP